MREQIKNVTAVDPFPGELAGLLGINVDGVKELLYSNSSTYSLDSLLGSEDDSTFLDVLEDNTQSIQYRYVELIEDTRLMMESLNILDSRVREVLMLRYGLEDSDIHTLDEIGRLFGLTRERIRQIERDAILKIRQSGIGKQLLAQ